MDTNPINPKKADESNEIGNRELKETIANAALQVLTEGEDYTSLAYTTCTFGYLYYIENHGLEGLLKLITDKDTFYFAAQKESLLRLNFTEELFDQTVAQFLESRQ